MNLVEKYRPRKLADILGQEWIVHQLESFVEQPYSCAFLFEGSSGVGKTSAAMVLAESLGVAVEQEEIGGLWQIASGEQTGETVRRAVDNLRTRPWAGSGWKVLIVNEADCMSANASYTWLDVLENLPLMTVVIFTTNAAHKIHGRLRDRCERFDFQSGALLMRPALQELVNRVWLVETGRTDAPEVESLGEFTDANGDASFRRVLQRLTPFVRAALSERSVPRPVMPRAVTAAVSRAAKLVTARNPLPDANRPNNERRPATELDTYGQRFAGGESIHTLAREAGMEWNVLAAQLKQLGYRKPQKETVK
jgi:replication-associated recombination protein RarA